MSLKELCQKYNISFKKSLGQNLLLDDNINRIMVDAAALTKDDDVVEVGAGLGALTKRLVVQAGRLLSVEIDRAFMPCLEDQFGSLPNMRLFRGDILNHELEDLVNEYLPNPRTLKMVSNLPYYITTPILFHFLEAPLFFSRIVVMVQEEVALRMGAGVNSSDYGVLTLALKLHADVDIVHRVPASCFAPRPKVDSCIVRLRCLTEPRYADVPGDLIMKLVRTSFNQRRKTLRNSLGHSAVAGHDGPTVLAAAEAAGIDLTRRPQTLSLDEFAAIGRNLLARSADKGE